MKKLKAVVAGGGLISQVEHIPNLLFLRSKFDLVAVAEPSAEARDHIERQFGVKTVPDIDSLWPLGAEVIIIAAPDAYHHEYAAEALDRRLHVFCEKPLAVSLEAIDDLIQRRDAANRILQVGYMKRFDPSYELLAEQVAGRGFELRFIAVEVNDPDSWPFVDHHAFLRSNDIPDSMKATSKAKLLSQASKSIGRSLSPDDLYAYVDSYSSSMIHDLNVVHGLLDRMGVKSWHASSANIFSGGKGTSATMCLNGSQALCHLAHVVVPKLAEYQERISLFFDDSRFELIFPSPYLHNQPTRLLEYRSDGLHLKKTEHRSNYRESFVRELEGFWNTIVEGSAPRNTAEDARQDMRLIRDFMNLALSARAAA